MTEDTAASRANCCQPRRRYRALNRFTVVVDSSVPFEATPSLPFVRVQLHTSPDRAASADGHRSLRDLWAMSRALTKQSADCLLFPSVYTYVPSPRAAHRRLHPRCDCRTLPELRVRNQARATLLDTENPRRAASGRQIVTVSQHAATAS